MTLRVTPLTLLCLSPLGQALAPVDDRHEREGAEETSDGDVGVRTLLPHRHRWPEGKLAH